MSKADVAAVLSLFHKNKEIIVIFRFYCVLLWRFLIKRLSMTIKEYFEGDRFAMDAGIIIDEIKEGYALLHMTVDERHLNGAGWCQGGAIFTLADLAFACATNSRGVPTVTVAANITLLRPVAPGTAAAQAPSAATNSQSESPLNSPPAHRNASPPLQGQGHRREQALQVHI